MGNDSTRYTVNGTQQNTFHRISHRIDSDGSEGTPIANADVLHHEIDKLFAGVFKRFLDKLNGYLGPSGGTLLDDSRQHCRTEVCQSGSTYLVEARRIDGPGCGRHVVSPAWCASPTCCCSPRAATT